MENNVFGISSPPSPTKVAKAINIKANISGAPKVNATSASGGANKVNKITEIVPLRTMPSLLQQAPCRLDP